jgi:Flp pilus assembly secretin CpaC
MNWYGKLLLVSLVAFNVAAITADAQPPKKRRTPPWYIEPTPETRRKVDQLIESVRDAETTMQVDPRKSRLVRTKRPVLRISITDPSVVDIVQYSPTEFEIIGGRPGLTTMTIWFAPDPGSAKPKVVRGVVRGGP